MFLVVLDHVVISNFIGGRNGLSINNAALWLLYLISNWCNIIFGMVSGYLMYTKRPKANRVCEIWLETFFYSVLCFLVLVFSLHIRVTHTQILNAIFPILRNRYWYLTAYFEMLIFVPLMNIVIRHIPRNTALISMLLFFVCIIVLPLIFSPRKNFFNLGSGKNAFGLMLFYFMGAYIRKFKLDQLFMKKTWWKVLVTTLAVGWISKFGLALIKLHFGWRINPNLLVKGTNISPVALIGAFTCFCIFKNINFNERWHHLLKLFSAASLGVYLIHMAVYPILQYQVMLPQRSKMNPFLLLGLVLLITFVIDVACSLLDLVRIYLFQVFQIKKFALFVGNHFEHFLAYLRRKFDTLFAKKKLS